jgi:hypothetical protein
MRGQDTTAPAGKSGSDVKRAIPRRWPVRDGDQGFVSASFSNLAAESNHGFLKAAS